VGAAARCASGWPGWLAVRCGVLAAPQRALAPKRPSSSPVASWRFATAAAQHSQCPHLAHRGGRIRGRAQPYPSGSTSRRVWLGAPSGACGQGWRQGNGASLGPWLIAMSGEGDGGPGPQSRASLNSKLAVAANQHPSLPAIARIGSCSQKVLGSNGLGNAQRGPVRCSQIMGKFRCTQTSSPSRARIHIWDRTVAQTPEVEVDADPPTSIQQRAND
jgi:hypothetical protein